MEPQGLPTTPKLPTAPQPPRPIPPLPPARTSAQPEAARAPSSATYSLPNPADIRQPTLSPLPPRLSLTTSFPLAPTPPLAPQQPDAFVATSAVEAQSEDIELPTYAHLQSQEVGNPRFGRWKGWIEKRARERVDERDAKRATGASQPSGWDLPVRDGAEASAEGEDNSEGRARHARAEQRMSRQQPTGLPGFAVTNPDAGGSSPSLSTRAASASMSPSSSLQGWGVQPLTKSMSIHPLGSRFAKGLEERPRTGVVLPSGSGGARASKGVIMERFMLVGTEEGLHLVDLIPTLSPSAPLRTTSPTAGQPAADEATIFPLWTGLGVLQLKVILELSLSHQATGSAPKGIVVGLVKPEGGETELRMWSLASLSNLARWRVYNEYSTTLDLSPTSTISNASGNATASPTSHEGKRSSRAYIKSLFTSSSSPDPSSPIDKKGKGKARVTAGAVAVPTPLRQSLEESEEGEFVLLDRAPTQGAGGHSRGGSSASSIMASGTPLTTETEARLLGDPRSRTSSSASACGVPTPTSPSPSPLPANSTLSLPLEWATSSIRLPLPKHAGPILFFDLTRTPPRNPEVSHPRREAGIREQRNRAEKERLAKERGTVWLVVATARAVYLFESRKSERRRWSLVREFYAPATPRHLSLVRALPPHSSDSPPPLARRDSKKGKRASTAPSSTKSETAGLPNDLAVLLGMKDKAVLINLVDSSVREVELPVATQAAFGAGGGSNLLAPEGSSSSHHSRSRSKTSASASSISSTGAGSTLSAASSLTARALEVASGKVAALVEGKQGIPAGMRDSGMEGKLTKGRKVDEFGAALSEAGASKGAEWVGCTRMSVLLGGRGSARSSTAMGKPTLAHFYLLTKGSTTHVYPSPLPSASTPGTAPPSPLTTFTFPLTSSSPLISVHPLLRIHSLKPAYRAKGLIHLVLLAYTRTGVHVKEGIVNPSVAAGSSRTWFEPLSAYAGRGELPLLETREGPRQKEEEEGDELEGQASLDFGREVVRVCEGGPWVAERFGEGEGEGESSDDDDDDEGVGEAEMERREAQRVAGGGSFFFVKGVGDWGVQWLG